jgi:hypothetical protein
MHGHGVREAEALRQVSAVQIPVLVLEIVQVLVLAPKPKPKPKSPEVQSVEELAESAATAG